MSLNVEEQALINEALNVLNDGLKQLSSVTSNSKIQLAIKIIEGGITVVEMML